MTNTDITLYITVHDLGSDLHLIPAREVSKIWKMAKK